MKDIPKMFSKNIKYIAITLGLGVVTYYIYKKFLSDENNEEIGTNTIEKSSNLIYSIPNKKGKLPIIYIFGGINYATPDWMLKQTPEYLLSRAFIVFAPYTASFDSVKAKAEKYIETKNLNVNKNKVSITGFSAGGLNVQKSYNKDFDFVGLIDPSTRKEYLDLPLDKNVKMVYNDSNWGGLPKIKEVLPKLNEKINSSGGNSEKVKLGHSDIPKYFFEKFKDELI